VASDEPLELDVPVLDLNDAEMVAHFIEQRFLKNSSEFDIKKTFPRFLYGI
jgi:hypothetical protein